MHRTSRGLALVCLAASVLASCGGEEPFFQSVNIPGDTYDPVGPYRVEAYVVTPHGATEVVLDLLASAEAESSNRLPLTFDAKSGEAERWLIDLPGRPAGTTYSFYLTLYAQGGKKATFPDQEEGAPKRTTGFSVLALPDASE